jgi:hypothetical protein
VIEDKRFEGVENLSCQGYRSAVAKEAALLDFQPERAELEGLAESTQDASSKLRTIQGQSKDSRIARDA